MRTCILSQRQEGHLFAFLTARLDGGVNREEIRSWELAERKEERSEEEEPANADSGKTRAARSNGQPQP